MKPKTNNASFSGRNFLIALTLFAGPWLHGNQAADPGIFNKYYALNGTVLRAKKEFSEQKFAQCEKDLKRCTDSIPDHYEAHYLLAQIAYHKSDFTKALEHIEAAKRSLVVLDEEYKKQAEEIRKGNEGKKQELQETIHSINSHLQEPGAGCGTSTLSDASNSLRTMEQKESGTFQVKEPFATPASYFFVHGNCLFKLGRYEEALEQYKTAIQEDPQHAESWNNLVNLLYVQKKYDDANLYLKQAEDRKVSIHPKLRQAVLDAVAK